MGASRDVRAKSAKEFINRKLPAILKSNVRARRGVESAELIVDPPTSAHRCSRIVSSLSRDISNGTQQVGRSETRQDKEVSSSAAPAPALCLRVTDTLEAASQLIKPSSSSPYHQPRVAILNMASPLRPGGGVLTGATSQEEWLCARTTLYPSLHEEFYRLPEVGGIYTTDILVCKTWDAEASDLKPEDRFFVDVVTAAMLRHPDLEERDGETTYAEQKDRDLVLQKMRAVMRILRSKGVEKVVLGAWGCGAYANPVGEIARAWRRVLFGSKAKKTGQSEVYTDIEILFAIKDRRMAHRFAEAFGPGLVLDDEEGKLGSDESLEESKQ